MADFDPKDSEKIARMAGDSELSNLAERLFNKSCEYNYSYNFTWLGRPIIQYPQDVLAIQEILWKVKPDLIVETGIAHGGSLIFSASMLELIGRDGMVLGVDVDIREHNRIEIERHPMASRISMIQGSSTDPAVVNRVREFARGKRKVLVILDSNHTHDHVLEELRLYSPLVKKDSYVVVLDTVIEHMPDKFFRNRPWGKGNNPKTAVVAFLKESDRFEVDREMEHKLLITVAPSGYLRCVRDGPM